MCPRASYQEIRRCGRARRRQTVSIPQRDEAARQKPAAARNAALSERTRRQDIAGRRPRHEREQADTSEQEPQELITVVSLHQTEVSATLFSSRPILDFYWAVAQFILLNLGQESI